jgi:hypothetical protein
MLFPPKKNYVIYYQRYLSQFSLSVDDGSFYVGFTNGNLNSVFFFLQAFPHKEELLRNMMGLLGNVAEVKALRRCLMTSQFVSVFADLLDTSSEGIEVLCSEIEIGRTLATCMLGREV